MSTDDDTSKPKSPAKSAQATARQKRLASQLRTNLKKRKTASSPNDTPARTPIAD